MTVATHVKSRDKTLYGGILMTEVIEIRKAIKKDLPLIFDFIKQLAGYQNLTNRLTATEEILEETLFGTKIYAEAILCYFNKIPVGFALYFYNFSTFSGRPGIYIEDLFIQAAYREKGIGKKIIAYLAHLAENKKCTRLEWSVLNSNKTAINFYNHIGAKNSDEWKLYNLSGKELKEMQTLWAQEIKSGSIILI